LAFDLGNTVLYRSLCAGSELHIIDKDRAVDARALSRYIKDNKISFYKITPSHFRALTSEVEMATLIPDHFLMFGGEELDSKFIDKILIRENKKYCILLNHYGPTEATVGCCTFEIKKNERNTVPIGLPISNTQIYILDEYMNVVPRGMSGELYVGGVGLARGYLNHPDLTAEKFVPNPFYNEENDASSLRLYKTGDLARYLEDGNIEFLGRIDNQIKVRGFRIEPGEIESVLESHRDIASVIVTAIEDEEKNKQIVAYIVPKDTSSFNKESEHISSADETFYALAQNIELTESLRVLAAEKLPEYMIPSFFVYIDRIPLNANGKADRKSLPVPDRSKRQVAEAYVEPTTEIEKVLVDIWKDVLKVEKVGIHDNFFKLGGHSLLAIQVIGRVKEKCGVTLRVRDIFDNLTISDLVKYFTPESKEILTTNKDQQQKGTIPLPLSQRGLWFLHNFLPNASIYNSSSAWELEGELKIDVLESALNFMILRHESFRTAIRVDLEHNPYIKIIENLKIAPDIIEVDVPQNAEEFFINTLLTEETQKSFDLANPPLIRAKIVKLSNLRTILIITVHHIIFDEWSKRLFLKELSVAYNSYLRGTEVELDELNLTYSEFVNLQNTLMLPRIKEQIHYWQKTLSSMPRYLNICRNRDQRREISCSGKRYYFSFGNNIKADLLNIAQEEKSSLFIVLLTIVQIFLHKYSGQNDILIGIPISNRHDNSVEKIIGFVPAVIVLVPVKVPPDANSHTPAAAGAALVQLVPSLVNTFPLVPGAAYVSVEAAQFVPSDFIIFPVVAEALGNVGVDNT
jgi:acyl carrier protein